MQWRYIENNWHTFQPIIRQRWSEVSDLQLEEVAGRRKHFSKLIEGIYGVSHFQAEHQLTEWQDSVISIDGQFYINSDLMKYEVCV